MISLPVLKAEGDFPGEETPKYPAIETAVIGFYEAIKKPLAVLQRQAFMLIGLPKPKAESFRYTAANRKVMDEAIDLYLEAIAGEDRTRKGYARGGTDPDSPDPVLQSWQRFSFAAGLRRGSDLTERPQTISAERQSPATQKMLDNAFSRLSEGGKLKLEQHRDQIHSVLVSATEAGLSPLDTGRQLSHLFSDYSERQFKVLTRTEAAYAAIEGSVEQMSELGVQFVVWLLDASACAVCQSFEGLLIGIEETDRHPPGASHPQCLCDLAPA